MNEYLNVLVKNLPDTFYRVDLEGFLTFISPSVEKLLGYKAEELLGTQLANLYLDKNQRQLFLQQLEAGDGQTTKFRAPLRHKDGTMVWVSTSADYYRDRDGKVAGIEGISKDVTSEYLSQKEQAQCRGNLENEVAERQKAASTLDLYEWIVDFSPNHISFLDRNYIYQTVNKAYLKAHKKSRADIIGSSVADLLGEEIFASQVKEKLDCCLSGEVVRYESWFEFPEARRRFMEVVYQPYYNNRGAVLGVVVESHDITERKLSRMELLGYQQSLQEANQALQQQVAEQDQEVRARTLELQLKNQEISDSNTTLRVMLEQQERGKTEIEQTISKNLKENIIPYLELLKSSLKNEKGADYVRIIEANIGKITSTFNKKLSSELLNLTPREMRVANLVRQGLSSKEIAEILKLTPGTVEFYRQNLRKKLGLNKQKINLRTYLLSFSGA